MILPRRFQPCSIAMTSSRAMAKTNVQGYATGELVLMDATYKMTRYAIPLYLVRVHTNVGYKVVAEFMCQSEDQASINEALAIMKG